MEETGAHWFNRKAALLVDYTKAYLEKMKSRRYLKVLYFDGFAVSGRIEREAPADGTDSAVAVAKKLLALDTPCPFDMYYFIEKSRQLAKKLQKTIDTEFPSKKMVVSVVTGDSNEMLRDLAAFLREGRRDRKVLACIDPSGMQLQWESIACLKGLDIDLWIPVPLGMGVSRLLKKDGNIADSWMKKLQDFLGLTGREIRSAFYEDQPVLPLFGKTTESVKKDKAIQIAGRLYRTRLQSVFRYVSQPLVMVNRKNNIMYHFIFSSNTRGAVTIADTIIAQQREQPERHLTRRL